MPSENTQIIDKREFEVRAGQRSLARQRVVGVPPVVATAEGAPDGVLKDTAPHNAGSALSSKLPYS